MGKMKHSKSSKAEYLSCQRKYWHSRIKKTDTDPDYRKGKALNFGSAFADCQELFRQDWRLMTTQDVIRIVEKNNLGVTEAAQMMACLRIYFANIPDGEKVEKVEAWIEHPLLIGRLDKIATRKDGKRYILEDKTSSEINQAVLSVTLKTDPQLCAYASAAKQFDAEGIIYRVVQKPKEKRKKEESWLEYTQRCKCEFLELQFAFEELEIDACIREFEAFDAEVSAKKTESEFMCNKQNCVSFGSACAWYSRCHGVTYTVANGDW
jgi:hypothetical protein